MITNGAHSQDHSQPAATLSDLELALLGLLSIRPMTGYEIGTHYARALSPWWETPRTQVYPKLRELERRGFVQKETVIQDGRPNKQVYSIAPTGSNALLLRLGAPIPGTDMRHHMMMRLFLGNLLPPQSVRKLLADYRSRMLDRARHLREARQKFTPSLDGPHRSSVFFELLSLDHLIALTELEVTGTTRVLEALAQAPLRTRYKSASSESPLLDALRRRDDTGQRPLKRVQTAPGELEE
ncbi:PadR family transcriptional regulator [Nocardia amikacinitolerans]|uniref:PadR family transcriptional regulator n=1 Tax=Nocardia amikacinitolerans TaxID=756689 RepID=UPI000A733796|nr:PadR family transcriptional regulator [Nocardia amikacinitolerans]MCP2281048.1 DNA-binding transcriptional regulator, PadR family [Nocardia amikacinitolerans]MCP2300071.1 DNA-binding transcriptional regulator, PadR family [Nocardia amikacinitolerans]MCP2320209.1 DNA-binding transcriptional regulator, PadR family [Nocardia amikacinitolerans]